MKSTQGSAAIYIIMLMLLMMTSAAVVLSGVFSKHIRYADNYLSSEKAFAAANSSVEEMLYKLAIQGVSPVDENTGTIEYDNGAVVNYKGKACISSDGKPHLTGSGEYQTLIRRIEIGGGTEGSC